MPSATLKIFLVHGDAKRLRTAELSNWTGKAVAGPRSEFDEPALGADFLVPLTVVAASNTPDKLFCEIKGHKATGTISSSGIIVFKGSHALLDARPSAHKYPWVVNLRQKLIDEGTLVTEGGALVFTQDTEFTSPSAAAAVVHGGTANGLTAWKNKDGKTLKELESI